VGCRSQYNPCVKAISKKRNAGKSPGGERNRKDHKILKFCSKGLREKEGEIHPRETSVSVGFTSLLGTGGPGLRRERGGSGGRDVTRDKGEYENRTTNEELCSGKEERETVGRQEMFMTEWRAGDFAR